jgi:hypothetical protein
MMIWVEYNNMDKETLNNLIKQGQTESVSNPNTTKVSELTQERDMQNMNDGEIIKFIAILRAIKRPRSTAPTNTPRNFIEQIELYENGATYRVYFYVGGVWRYATLT